MTGTEVHWLKTPGEMARRIREHDWQDSPLGPIAGWDQTLRTAVDLMLASGHAMQLAWGPERIVLYNDAYAPILGKRHPAAFGRRVRDIWPEAWEDAGPVIDRVFAGETVRFEGRPSPGAGSSDPASAWWSFSCSPVRDERGVVVGLLNVPLGAAPAVRAAGAEKALGASERQLRHVFERMTEAFGLMDRDLRIVTQNNAALEMDGRTLEELVGLTHEEAYPGADPELERLYRHALARNEPVQLEHRHEFDDGDVRWLEMRAFPVPEGLAVFWRDVTGRKEAEEALAEELRSVRILHDIAARLVSEENIRTIHEEILGAALAITRAEAGVVQMHDDEHGALVTLASRGLGARAQRQLRAIPASIEDGAVDAEGSRGGARTCHDLDPDSDDPAERALVREGLHAGRSTALRSRAGEVLGVVSTYWRQPGGRLSDRALRFLDLLARQAADLIGQRREEAARRRNEARLESALSISTVGVLFWDCDGRITDTNGAFLQMSGFAPDELQGMRWQDLTPPEFHARSQAFLDEVEATGEGPPYEKQYLRADGSRWWGLFSARRMEAGYVEFVIDITGAKEARARLEESEERLASVVEIGQLGLWDWDIVTGRVLWSDEHYRMMGLAVGAVEPSYALWASGLHPDDRAPTEAALAEAMAERHAFNREFRVVREDGTVRWLHGRGRFVYSGKGRPVRMIGAVVDTTERREWEDCQEVLIRELQHRTFNLLGVVRSVAEGTLVSSRDLPEFRKKFAERIAALARVQRHLSRLGPSQRITFDALIEGELEAIGALPPDPERLRLSGPRGVALRSASVQIFAMALHELVTNALKHGALGRKGGRLDIAWEVRQDERDRSWLHLEWRESGVPMNGKADPPAGTGQGRALIEEALPFQLSARTTFTLGADGVHCTIALPVSDQNGTS
ncbi:MAG: PAS domain S-box protein [Porphyrobacter sp.]|nr:PAS domain S-box protein [Porphyrobacter sp.]